MSMVYIIQDIYLKAHGAGMLKQKGQQYRLLQVRKQLTFYLVEFSKMSSINSFISENPINGVISLGSKRFLKGQWQL